MAKIEYKGKEYKSRAELARTLLMENTMRKSEIATITGIAPQTVHGQYQRLVKAGKMEDVYGMLVEKLNQEDDKARKATKAEKAERKSIRKQAQLAIKARLKEVGLKTKPAKKKGKELGGKVLSSKL